MGVQNSTMEINAVRPLSELALKMEREFKEIVTYEDPVTMPAIEYSSNENKMNLPLQHILIKIDSSDTVKSILEKGINAYNNAGFPVSFSLLQNKYGYHIHPDYFLNEYGSHIQYKSLLQTHVKIDSTTTNGFEALEKILNAWNESIDQQIEIGSIPNNLFLGKTVTLKPQLSAVNEYLIDLFLSIGKPLSWQLLNIPNTDHFFLNIHEV